MTLAAMAIVALLAVLAVAAVWTVCERAARSNLEAVRELNAAHAAQLHSLIERVQAPPLTLQAFAPGPVETSKSDADIDAEWAKSPFAAVRFDDDLAPIAGIDDINKEQ